MSKFIQALLMLWGLVLSQPTFAVADQDTVEIKASPQAARVISCAIRFPIDSVKFAEDQVHKCIQAVNIDAVSYIHIIATADSSGSGRHNLYLSTRRAGAIEAFLINRYPNIPVHAFGGGENPKFGKLARIFIVEHQKTDTEEPIQVASIGTPEIIERTTTEYVTKTEYRDRPLEGLEFTAHTGPALSTLSDDFYSYAAFELKKSFTLDFIKKLNLTLRHRLLQSNEALDLNATSILVGTGWNLTKIYGQPLSYEQTLDFGQFLANGRSLEWGLAGALGLSADYFKISLIAAKSNYLTSMGVGLGVRL